ncbi:hypothetical protein NG99_25070 [Erwinia typographi]|uniref:Lipoprotein n=1 Tax=Erwinia typographi TaxID=371042 RepID=A0A0A3ZLR7_9GAMM|nr:hypothetical protein [Erwinia typographi]KGT86683.1 hypothetical protein NG99_25070 [Erwinia typographi]
MCKLLLPIILTLCSQMAWSSVTPDVAEPNSFNKDRFVVYYNKVSTMGYGGSSECEYVSLKIFYPPEYVSSKDKYPPSNPWLCLFAVDVIHDGYGPGRLIPEKIYFDKKNDQWKKKKFSLNREDFQESLKRYGIKGLKDLHSVELYNIQSVNARGYAVIDSNIPLWEKRKGVKKNVSFCMIHEETALCGYGPMVYSFDGEDVDFTPYMLRSLETIEMGLPEKPNNGQH